MAGNVVLFSLRLPPIPAIPFDEHTNLDAEMVNNLITRLRSYQAALKARIAEVAELRAQVAALQVICDGLAEDLEAVYDCQDQGARALAAQAAEEVRDEQDR